MEGRDARHEVTWIPWADTGWTPMITLWTSAVRHNVIFVISEQRPVTRRI
jgi:hypothetical protein